MFEHFFDANSPFAGLVYCHWPMPLHGLAAAGLYRWKCFFAKDTLTELVSWLLCWLVLFLLTYGFSSLLGRSRQLVTRLHEPREEVVEVAGELRPGYLAGCRSCFLFLLLCSRRSCREGAP